jgi:capsular polysaccharide biosynthesis protein
VEVQTLVDLLRRWWVALLLVAAVAGIAGYLVAERLPVVYSSTSRALVGPVDASAEFIRAARENLETYSALLTSEPSLQTVVDRQELQTTAADLRAQVQVRTDGATRIITITAIDQDPAAAADLANAMVGQLSRLSIGAAPENRIQIVERGQLPAAPESPGTARSAAVAMFGGLLGTVLAIVALEFASGRVRGRYDLEQLVSGPFLGDARIGREASRRTRNAIDPGATLARALESLAPKPVSILIPANDEDSWDASLGAALWLARGARRNQAVALLVTGSGVGESRDTSVRPLKIPANRHRGGSIRPGTLHTYSGPELGPIDDVESARRQLDGLSERGFDLTIIHVQPLHQSSLSVVWARAAEAAIIVATAGKTRRDRLQYTLETLSQIGTPVLGSLLIEAARGGVTLSAIEQDIPRAQGRSRGQARRVSGPRSQPEDVAER